MKKLIIIPIILLVVMSCSKSDSNETNIPPDLIGKWQLKGIAGVSIINGGYMEFKLDNTFTTTIYPYYPDYLGGTYTVSPTNEISLNFISSANQNNIRTTQISLISIDRLTLSPTDRTCDEGCWESYHKVIIENQSGKK